MKRTLKPVFVALVATCTVLITVSTAGADKPKPSSFTVDTVADTLDADPGDGWCADVDGNCSLRAAVQEANAGDVDHVHLGKAHYKLDLVSDGDIIITDDLHLDGRGSTIDLAALGDRAFDIARRRHRFDRKPDGDRWNTGRR